MKPSLKIDVSKDCCFVNGVPVQSYGETAMMWLSSAIHSYYQQVETSIDGLYNKNIYWPECVKFAVEWTFRQRFSLEPTQHAFDRIKKYNLPMGCYTTVINGEVVEAELKNGSIVKVVTRTPQRVGSGDICAAIALSKNDVGARIATIVTVWINDNRNMVPLDLSKYIQAPEPR